MRKLLTTLIIAFILMLQYNMSYGQWMHASGGNSFFSCNNGELKTCGGNYYSHIGVDTTSYYIQTPSTSSVTDVIAIGCAAWHTLFLKSDGTVWAAGRNTHGQLGDGSITDRNIPQPILGLTDVIAVAAGDEHSIFLKSDSTVWGCGYNIQGCLGDGTNIDRYTPIQIPSLTGVKAIECGRYHSVFLKGNGTVWATGSNSVGELGVIAGPASFTPLQIDTLTNIVAISSDYDHNMFLRNDSTVWVCGFNQHGRLGDGTTTTRFTPVQITTVSRIIGIEAGGWHSLFLKYDGSVWGCGYNYNGALGNVGTLDHLTPTLNPGISNVTNISAGGHSLFMKNDGSVWGCGAANSFQLGDGTNIDKFIPVLLPTLNPIISTTPSPRYACSGSSFEIPIETNVPSTVSWNAIDNPNTTGETLLPQSNDTIVDTVYNLTATFDTVIYLVTTQGCYSAPPVEIDVIINPNLVPVDTLVNEGWFSLSANGIGEVYQWYDCNIDDIIPWATDSIFYPFYNGDFALIITQQGCTDTSGCHNIFGLGIEDVMNADEIVIYPNPVSDECMIQFPAELQKAKLTIIDVHGGVVRNISNVTGTNIYLRKENIRSGIYLLILEVNGNLLAKKIVFD